MNFPPFSIYVHNKPFLVSTPNLYIYKWLKHIMYRFCQLPDCLAFSRRRRLRTKRKNVLNIYFLYFVVVVFFIVIYNYIQFVLSLFLFLFCHSQSLSIHKAQLFSHSVASCLFCFINIIFVAVVGGCTLHFIHFMAFISISRIHTF